MDRQNKKCSCVGKNGRWNNNAGTEKVEENKLSKPQVKKEVPAEGCSRRYGKWEECSGQKKISDDRQQKEEENKLAGTWLTRKCLLKDALEGMINGRKFEAEEDIK